MHSHLRFFCFASFLIFISFNSLNAQWTKTNGIPSAGAVRDFEHFGDTIIANGTAGIYFSGDEGLSWNQMNLDFEFDKIWKVISDDKRIVLHARKNDENKLFITSNFGNTYNEISIPDSFRINNIILVEDEIFLNAYYAFAKISVEGGDWELLGNWNETRSQVGFDGEYFYATDYPNLTRSGDLGQTWDTLYHFGSGISEMLIQNGHIVLFGNPEIYHSSDQGVNWERFPGIITGNSPYNYIWHDGSIYSIHLTEIYKSSDFGKNWQLFPTPIDNYGMYTGISTGDVLLVSSFVGVNRTEDDGATWTSTSKNGLFASGGRGLSVANNKLFVGTYGSFYQMKNDELNWEYWYPSGITSSISWASPYFFNIIESGDNLVLTGEGLEFSPNGGDTWARSNLIGINSLYYSPEYIKSSGTRLFTKENSYGVLFSDNNGVTFRPLPPISIDGDETRIVQIDVDNGILFAVARDSNFYRSPDEGITWELVSENVQKVNNYTQLYVRGNSVFIFSRLGSSANPYLFSDDMGVSWQIIDPSNSPLPGVKSSPIFNTMISAGNYLIAGNQNGILISKDSGHSWETFNEGLSSHLITDLQIYKGFLYASVQFDGIWKRSLSDLDLEEITGTVFFDENKNNVKEIDEKGIGGVIIRSKDSQGYSASQNDGTYSFITSSESETLEAITQKNYWKVEPDGITISPPAVEQDFALSVNENLKDLKLDLTSVTVWRPGFEPELVISWKNEGPSSVYNASVELDYNADKLTFLSANQTPDFQNSGNLEWLLGDLDFGDKGFIKIRFRLSSSVPLNETLCFSSVIEPVAGDFTPQNNQDELCNITIGSYDPNDKQADRGETILFSEVRDSVPLTYTIRFQNTGTYLAENVRILDTLANEFDPATFEFIGSSHHCDWSLKKQGILEFAFDNIQLPDSTADEPNSHGFVKYSIAGKSNLPVSSILTNRAHIYFDFNDPIITNTTKTKVVLPVSTDQLFSSELKIYPNPAFDKVQIETSIREGEFYIMDLNQKILSQNEWKDSNPYFSCKQFTPGTYLILIVGSNKEIQLGKFVKI